MAKSKKSTKASRGSRSSKPSKGRARRLPGLEKALTEMISTPRGSGSGKRGRKWKDGRLEQSALDAVAAGKGRVERKLAAGALGVRGDGKPLELPSGGPVAAPARATRMLSDPRLPAVGQVIVKTYKGRELRVIRLTDRFEFEGRDYPSLSKIAREVIGGAQVNGFAFFGLTKPAAATEAVKGSEG